ncbi:MAG: exodeoxyribonuclease VII large subunit [Anaeroplasmataceae bacterium]
MNNNSFVTINALNKYIKYKFDNDKHLLNLTVKGQVSNFKMHSVGHFYFSIKDETSQISCIMYASDAAKMNFILEDGQMILLSGRVSVYEKNGTYQIIANNYALDGIGELHIKFEKIKKHFLDKGYFDESYKKEIPFIPKSIGIITSPTGAAVEDIINTISRRFSLSRIIIYPCLVQGNYASSSISKQIYIANENDLCDVLIVGRGGGSLEDLWAFNEPEVIEAIFKSKIPIISAVGHETDITLSDFVSDLRAITPTAAAELATPNIDDIRKMIFNNLSKINYYFNSKMNYLKLSYTNIDNLLMGLNPLNQLKSKYDTIGAINKRINNSIMFKINDSNRSFSIACEKLNILNPLNLMKKGYSIAKRNETVITTVNNIKIDDILEIDIIDGTIKTKVIEVENYER